MLTVVDVEIEGEKTEETEEKEGMDVEEIA